MLNNINFSQIVGVVESSGKKLVKCRLRNLKIKFKKDGSECTDADLKSNDLICGFLIKNYPHIPIISEELVDEVDYKAVMKSDYFWCLDPLDGTHGYIRNGKNYSVNLALIYRGKPIFGIICLPEQQKTYYNEGNSLYLKMGDHKSLVEAKSPSSDVIRVIISKRSDPTIITKFFKPEASLEFESIYGATKFCLLAEGKYDVFPRYKPTYEWDVAAGHALINAVGGVLLTADLKELTYLKPQYLNQEIIALKDKSNLKILCIS